MTGAGTDFGSLVNDKVIHERARLLILTYLASNDAKAVPFSRLRESLDFSAGNLSIQLKTLEEAGYIAISKEFKDNKPLTQASITAKGNAALKRYIGEMDSLIKGLRTHPRPLSHKRGEAGALRGGVS